MISFAVVVKSAEEKKKEVIKVGDHIMWSKSPNYKVDHSQQLGIGKVTGKIIKDQGVEWYPVEWVDDHFQASAWRRGHRPKPFVEVKFAFLYRFEFEGRVLAIGDYVKWINF